MGALITFLIAILSGLGIGSAGLYVMWLTFIEQTPQITAQGLNLLFFLFSSGAGLSVHVFRTPLLWRSLLPLIVSGLLGSLIGVSLGGVLPQALLRRLFGILLILAGLLGLFDKGKKP